jgi:hypothetical protein
MMLRLLCCGLLLCATLFFLIWLWCAFVLGAWADRDMGTGDNH